MVINGNMYNQPMPGVPSLTELEIAEIATFIYNNWGQQRGLIDVMQVSQSLSPCFSRPDILLF
jgi:cytochrome c551